MKHVLKHIATVVVLFALAIPAIGASNTSADLKESLQSLDSTIQMIKSQYDKQNKSKKLLTGMNSATEMEPIDQIYMLATSLETVSFDLKNTVEEMESSTKKNNPSVGHGKVKFSAYTQQQYHQEFGANEESDFVSRRARFIMKGNINSYAKIKIQTEFAGSPKLLDGAVTLSPNESWSLTAGQFKPPFGTDVLKSSSALPFVNRFMAEKLGTGRDIGAMMTFQQKINPSVKFKVSSGFFNGTGINKGDINNDKNFVGRAEMHYNKNLIIAANVISGKSNQVDSLKQNVESFGSSITARWKNEIVEAEYIYSKTDQTKKSGWYAWAGHTLNTNYAFIPAIQLLARYEQYDIDRDIVGDRRDRITIGTNLYVDNKYTKIQFNYQINNEEINAVDNNQFLVNLQVGF